MSVYGEGLRFIRKSKGLSQKELSDGILSHQALSKFERGESMIALDTLSKLIDRMNVSASEYHLICKEIDQAEDHEFNFLIDYDSVLKASDSKNLEGLREKEEEHFNTSGNVRHMHNIFMIDQRLHFLKYGNYDAEANQIVIDYLFSVDNWGYYELIFFNNAMLFLNNEHIELFIDVAIKKSEFFQKIVPVNRNLQLTVMLNFFDKLVREKQFESATKLYRSLQPLVCESKSYPERNRFNFIAGRYLMTFNIDPLEGQRLCSESLKIIKQLDKEEIYQIYLQEYQRHLNEIA